MLSDFKIYARQRFVVPVLAFWVAAMLDAIEHIAPNIVAGRISSPSFPFSFMQLEETLCDDIIVAVPAPSHAWLQIAPSEKRRSNAAGELQTLINTHRCTAGWLSPPNSHRGAKAGRHAVQHSIAKDRLAHFTWQKKHMSKDQPRSRQFNVCALIDHRKGYFCMY